MFGLEEAGWNDWRIDVAGVVPLTAKKVVSISLFSLNDLKCWRSCISPCQPDAIVRTDRCEFYLRNWGVLFVLFEAVVVLPMVFVMVSKFVLMKGGESDSSVQSLGLGTWIFVPSSLPS